MPQSCYSTRFVLDHIIARQHGGTAETGNLALCCLFCNRFKGPNIASIDPVTRRMSRLFHPRRDVWSEHFEWEGAILIGKTVVGRATIQVLAINDPNYVDVRNSLIREGLFPGW
jgi:hypothetical protein